MDEITNETVFLHKGTARLTIDHAASSYGQPVLVWHGAAYGPRDFLGSGGLMAYRFVEVHAQREFRDDHPLVRRFVEMGQRFSAPV